LTRHLLCYIITVCYPKMICRLKQPDLSMPYLESLKLVKVAEIEFRKLEPRISRSDRQFFLNFLPVIVMNELVCTDIPNILKAVNLMNETDKPVQFYTKDTYQEFHALLLELLEIFQQSLQGLQNYGNPHGDTKPGPDIFTSHLDAVEMAGLALQHLSRGAVLEMHLKTIESSLGEHRQMETRPTSMPESTEDEDEDLQAVQPR
ncbi:hypothetical protein BYT27DRAFT_7093772, partial [Phlegmacium glaucopus]